jgi:ubiquitin carboxyl-terminal hydrolase 7
MTFSDIHAKSNVMAQEIKPTMIEGLKAKQSLKAAELQDGDIICFQRTSDRKPGDRNFLEKRLTGDNKVVEETYVVARDGSC